MANAIPGGAEATNDDKGIVFNDRDSSVHRLSQQPYSEERPVFRSSALADSTAAPRTDTPLAASMVSDAAKQAKDQNTGSRAFSRSSDRRKRNDASPALEGPKRVQVKDQDIQTEPVPAVI